MEEARIIDYIVEVLIKNEIIKGYHKYQAGKAIQFKTIKGDFFNLCIRKLDSYANIIKNLKN